LSEKFNLAVRTAREDVEVQTELKRRITENKADELDARDVAPSKKRTRFDQSDVEATPGGGRKKRLNIGGSISATKVSLNLTFLLHTVLGTDSI
jgi:hypothetical protein